MKELKASAADASKEAVFLSSGPRTRLKSPTSIHGRSQLGARERSSSRKEPRSGSVHGAYMFVTTNAKPSGASSGGGRRGRGRGAPITDCDRDGQWTNNAAATAALRAIRRVAGARARHPPSSCIPARTPACVDLSPPWCGRSPARRDAVVVGGGAGLACRAARVSATPCGTPCPDMADLYFWPRQCNELISGQLEPLRFAPAYDFASVSSYIFVFILAHMIPHVYLASGG